MQKISGGLDTFIVTCHPSVMSSVFNIDMSHSPEIIIHLSGPVFLPLWQNMYSCSTTRQRLNCFDRFLAGVNPQPYHNDLIDVTFNNISKYCITTPLPDILKQTP
ncbi:MAG: hypothetical protein ACK5HT_16905, partial [Draconibacterium sp.]